MSPGTKTSSHYSKSTERQRALTVDSSAQEDRCHPRKVFIGGLAHKTTTQQIRDYFVRYGAVADAVVLRWSDGRSRGFGYVTFADAAAASAVLRDLHVICGRQVDVKRAVPGTNKLFVGGLPQNTTAAELREHFEQFGSVSDAVVLMDPATGRSRGFGFVCFVPGPEGMAAIATSFEQYASHRIRGKWIEVKSAVPPEKPTDESRAPTQKGTDAASADAAPTPPQTPEAAQTGPRLVDFLPSSETASPWSTPVVGVSPAGTPPLGTPSMGTPRVGPQVGAACVGPAPASSLCLGAGQMPVGSLMKLLASSVPDEPQKVPLCGSAAPLPFSTAIGSPPGLDVPMWGGEYQNMPPLDFNAAVWNNMLWQAAASTAPAWQNCLPVPASNPRTAPVFKAPAPPPAPAAKPSVGNARGGPAPDELAAAARALEWGKGDAAGRALMDSKGLFAKRATKDDLHKSLEQLLKFEAQRSSNSKYMGA